MTLEELQKDDYKLFRWACENGKLEVVDQLVHLAKKLDTKNKVSHVLQAMLQTKNYTGFRVACQNGHVKVVKQLVQLAKELDSVSPQWGLALMLRSKHCEAFFTSHLTILKKIIDAGNFCHVTIDYYEPLKYACLYGDIKIAKVFIKELKRIHYYDPCKSSGTNLLLYKLKQYNYSIFKETCGKGHLDIVKLLIKEAKELDILEDILKSDNYFCFQLACNLRKTDVSKYLLEESALLDVKIQNEMVKILQNSLCDKYGIGREHV